MRYGTATVAHTVWLEHLLPAAEDRAPCGRAAAAAALSVAVRCEPPEREAVAAVLVRLLADSDAEVRTQAVGGLLTLAASEGELLRPDVIGRLCVLVREDAAPRVRAAGVRALGWGPISPEKEAALAAALVDSSEEVRNAGVGAVASVGATEAMVPALLAALEVPEVAAEARQALEKLPEAKERMTEVLARLGRRLAAAIERAPEDGLEHDGEVEHLLRALGPAAVPHLQALTRVWDDLAFEPEEGLQATGRAGAAEVMRVLREGTPQERAASADALTAFASYPGVVDALVAAMRDEDPSVRAVAAAGLGLISSRLLSD